MTTLADSVLALDAALRRAFPRGPRSGSAAARDAFTALAEIRAAVLRAELAELSTADPAAAIEHLVAMCAGSGMGVDAVIVAANKARGVRAETTMGND